ncbi:MAG TPA: DNA translocase FtsK 4TM domain-containing protein [Acidobacteriota bacterium]|nr:DNA translocase FtsK 4TM domain-containing protein [Acidobacteriota bacterium]
MEQVKKVNELFGLSLMALAGLLILSLLTYSSQDPSWNVSSPAGDIANYAGRFGAWLADGLYQVLGFPALALPAIFFLFGYRRLRGRAPLSGLKVKAAALLVLLAALSTGLALLQSLAPQPRGFSPGGVVGSVLAEKMLTYFNRPGSLLIVLAAVLMALVASTRFSVDRFLAWMQRRNWRIPSWLPLSWLKRFRTTPGSGGEIRESSAPPPIPIEEEAPWEGPSDQESKSQGSSSQGSGQAPRVKVQDEYAARLAGKKKGAEYPLFPEMSEGREVSMPSLDFLKQPDETAQINKASLLTKAEQLKKKYAEFDVHGNVLQIHPGPVVTTFEFKPDAGVKYSKVTSLEQDLCLGLKAESVRIDRIPGKNTVGVEVPNDMRQTIYLREILASGAFHEADSPLTLALGKTINGTTYIADLARMPHLLIAGATGSGKSVSLNCMVCSVLYKAQPSEVRFIMVDPKRLELGLYADIPHLLTPIVTDPKQAANALTWAVSEMEQRYKLLARHGVRNIAQFNALMREKGDELEAQGSEECTPLPYIVIVVDELADLMMTAGKEVEAALTRLAQMARAIGIHLILATQRPSVDVITGLIKANFPCRMSFRVSSRIDSRTIIDGSGAESLLGMGDMLFLPPSTSRLIRLHGPYVSEKEIAKITGFLRQQAQPQYQEEILQSQEEEDSGLVDIGDMEDELFDEAARFVVDTRKASTSLLQRRFRIGYGRAARLLDMMEHEGLVSPPDGTKPRDVLVESNYFQEVDDRD